MARRRIEARRTLSVLALAAAAAVPRAAAAQDKPPPAEPPPIPTEPPAPSKPVAPSVPAGAPKPAPAPSGQQPPATPPKPAAEAPKPAAARAPGPSSGRESSGWQMPGAPEEAARPRSALMEAVEKAVGAPVHGRLAFRFEARIFNGEDVASEDEPSDYDLISHLDVRVGDETKDTLSAAAYVRSNLDIGHHDEDGGEDNRYLGLSDTYEDSFTAQLYTAYLNWRPKEGPVETSRFGRQYVYVADTFQFDGVSATTRPLRKDINLRFQAYGGIPVHFYEADGSGDWLAGVRASADPLKGTRAALDYAHVEDESAGYGDERNDLAAASVWQRIGENADLHGRFTWLDGPRDVLVRGSVSFPETDLLLQASYKRLLDEQEHLATEFDPYYSELRTEHEYHMGEIRAVKGLGEVVSVEAGASARRLIDDDDESTYNRDASHLWIGPSFDGLLLKDSTLTVFAEKWDGGDDDGTRTVTADYTYRIDRARRISVGTDFSRWDYGRVQDGERSNLRVAYLRFKTPVAEGWTMDFRYAWEHDDEETDHVLTLGLALEF